MKKFGELDDNEFNKINDNIDSVAESLETRNMAKNTEYGLCSKCEYFTIVKTEFTILRALCGRYEEAHMFILKSNKPVTECSDFKDKLTMSLYDMQKIAYIIESKENEIGFIVSKENKKQ